MPFSKRFFTSPLKLVSPKRNKGRSNSFSKPSNSERSIETSSPVTITSAGDTFVDSFGNEVRDDKNNEVCLERIKSMQGDDDFETTPTEINGSSSDTGTGIDEHLDSNFEKEMDYIPMPDMKMDSNGGTGSLDDDDIDDESPINSVVFEKKIETESENGGFTTKRFGSSSQISPLLSPCSPSDGRDGFNFDDYRSTISGLTEINDFRVTEKKMPMVPPSPTNSTASAGTKKMEEFLKTETEAIRQLLTEVDSADDESTVVEESMRGANEAERMAREMEREMELLIKGQQQDEILETTTTGNPPSSKEEIRKEKPSIDTVGIDVVQATYHQPQQETPDSNEFLKDFNAVIHPASSDSIEHTEDDDDKSLVSLLSQPSLRSPGSSRRNLFRKRNSLYRLKRQQERKKKLAKKKIMRWIKSVLLSLALCSMVFVANWRLNFSDQDFSNAAKSTMSQLKRNASKSARATQSYMGVAKNSMITGVQDTSSFLIGGAKHYSPIVAEQTKLGWEATQAFALRQMNSYSLTPEAKDQIWQGLQDTKQYVKDRMEYTFTDRAAREQRIEEERRLQKIMEAAAAAAAQEAAERQQQMMAQTMVAGACAFVGSVVTNYIWSAL